MTIIHGYGRDGEMKVVQVEVRCKWCRYLICNVEGNATITRA